MSSSSRSERKCGGQKFTQEDSLNRLDHAPLSRAGDDKNENARSANAEAERWARLVHLRAAVENGSYRVAPLDVADAMFRFLERDDTAARQMYSA